MIQAAFVGWLIGMGTFAALWFLYYRVTLREAEPGEPSAIDSLDLTPRYPGGIGNRVNLDGGEMGRGAPKEDFAVTRGPRHTPWSRRKKELEASARQKRRQLESFREEA